MVCRRVLLESQEKEKYGYCTQLCEERKQKAVGITKEKQYSKNDNPSQSKASTKAIKELNIYQIMEQIGDLE